eukprot:4928133-Heterocapsa_arctica.AAC.1
MLKKLDAKAPSDAAALRKTLAGGTWQQVRVAEVEEEASRICPSCGLQDEDEEHRWYICGKHNNFRLQHEWIRMK